jgi:hypothetical protein
MIQCSEESKRYFNAFTECQLKSVQLAETCTQLQTVCRYGVYDVIGVAVVFVLIGLLLKELFVYLRDGGWDFVRIKTLELYLVLMESAIRQATLPPPVIQLRKEQESITCHWCKQTVFEWANFENFPACIRCCEQLIPANQRPLKPLGLCSVCKEPQVDFHMYKGVLSCKNCNEALMQREFELTCSKCKLLKEANQMTLVGGEAPLCNYCYDSEFPHSPLGRIRNEILEESKTEEQQPNIVQ